MFKFDFKWESFLDDFEAYIEARLSLFRLAFHKELQQFAARLALGLMLGGAAILFVFFFSLGLAFFLNEVLMSSYAGFLWVAFIYGLVLIVIAANIKRLTKSVNEELDQKNAAKTSDVSTEL